MTHGVCDSITASCSRARRLGALAATGLFAILVSPAAIALAQNAQQPSDEPPAGQAVPAQPPSAQAPQGRGLFPAQPPPAERPGFVYEFGRWWDTTRGKLDNLSKESDGAAGGAGQDALTNAAEATKEAATALFRLPGTRVIEVRQRCEIAPNGAPDCRKAATNACRSKGFSDGHPVDVQSSQNCPPAVWMSGHEPAAGECPEETVVLMAACD
jgi:hypothetical protein